MPVCWSVASTRSSSRRLPYTKFAKPGVRLKREMITAIDPAARRVTTDAGVHECDHLEVALGAGYDMAATPSLYVANEFYSVAGANRLTRNSADIRQGPRRHWRVRRAVQVPACAQ